MRNFEKAQAEYEARLFNPFENLPKTEEEIEQIADDREYWSEFYQDVMENRMDTYLWNY